MTTIPRKPCEFSPCRRWRYTLWREWWLDDLRFDLDFGRPHTMSSGPAAYLQVIGLNPSTADETRDDPTIRRCIDFAKRWGFGALCMTNLFGWRDTLPENMKAAPEPVGADNDRWLREIAANAGMILCAWGKHGAHLGRADAVLEMLRADGRELHCLKRNSDGSPIHPLYVAGETKPILYVEKSEA